MLSRVKILSKTIIGGIFVNLIISWISFNSFCFDKNPYFSNERSTYKLDLNQVDLGDKICFGWPLKNFSNEGMLNLWVPLIVNTFFWILIVYLVLFFLSKSKQKSNT